MLKQKFVLMFSLIAIMATGAAYATAPSVSESVGTAHTVYTAASNVGTATTTDVESGIAGVTYVNRMVNTAGNAAQKAEAHAAAAGAYAIQAENAAKAAQTTANNVANKVSISQGEGKENKAVITDAFGNITTGQITTDMIANNAVTIAKTTGIFGYIPTSSSGTGSAQIWVE